MEEVREIRNLQPLFRESVSCHDANILLTVSTSCAIALTCARGPVPVHVLSVQPLFYANGVAGDYLKSQVFLERLCTIFAPLSSRISMGVLMIA